MPFSPCKSENFPLKCVIKCNGKFFALQWKSSPCIGFDWQYLLNGIANAAKRSVNFEGRWEIECIIQCGLAPRYWRWMYWICWNIYSNRATNSKAGDVFYSRHIWFGKKNVLDFRWKCPRFLSKICLATCPMINVRLHLIWWNFFGFKIKFLWKISKKRWFRFIKRWFSESVTVHRLIFYDPIEYARLFNRLK